jgi:hypothetical protein
VAGFLFLIRMEGFEIAAIYVVAMGWTAVLTDLVHWLREDSHKLRQVKEKIEADKEEECSTHYGYRLPGVWRRGPFD